SPLTVSGVTLPDAPRDLRALTAGPGEVDLFWQAGAVSDATGDAPTSFVVYASTDGQGFAPVREVSALQTAIRVTTTELVAALPDVSAEDAFFFRVEASNTGGRSLPSRVTAARPTVTGDEPRVLLVNGFDRVERQQNPVENRSLFFSPGNSGAVGGSYERVNPRLVNTFDYLADAGRAIAAFGDASIAFDGVDNEAVADGFVDLANYDAVVWLLGEEATRNDTFNASEQAAVSSYVAGGGKLFTSGTDIGWDLVANGTTSDLVFFNDTLKATYFSDDAGTYAVAGANGTLFEGLGLNFSDGDDRYDADLPDRLLPVAGGTTALTYIGGTGGTAGVAWSGGDAQADAKVVTLAVPFESILGEANRAEVMSRVLTFFGLDALDRRSPESVASSFDFDTAQAVTFAFDEDVSASLSTGDLQLIDLDTGLPVAALVALDIAPDGFSASWTIAANGLPDGNYRATLAAGDVEDAAGNPLSIDASVDFFVLAGDANRDRTVNLADFGVLRSNFGSTSAVFSDGDFNYDGRVDLADFGLLRAQFGTVLATPASDLFARDDES
ncbi:MAG: hypothetical protein AAF561_14840, partial [Planctomycetota bacterium]